MWKWTLSYIFDMQTNSSHVALANKGINTARNSIKILHHISYTMNDNEFVTQNFLSPSFKLMDTAIIFRGIFDDITVAQLVKQCFPFIFTQSCDNSAITINLTNKRIVICFMTKIRTRIEKNRHKARTREGRIEKTFTSKF